MANVHLAARSAHAGCAPHGRRSDRWGHLVHGISVAFVRELNAMNVSCTVSRFNPMPNTEVGPLTARTDLAESKARGKGIVVDGGSRVYATSSRFIFSVRSRATSSRSWESSPGEPAAHGVGCDLLARGRGSQQGSGHAEAENVEHGGEDRRLNEISAGADPKRRRAE